MEDQFGLMQNSLLFPRLDTLLNLNPTYNKQSEGSFYHLSARFYDSIAMESGLSGPTPSEVKTLFALQAISSLATLGATSSWAIGLYLLFQYFFDSHLHAEERRLLKFLVCWIGLADTVRQAFTIDAVIKGGGQLWGNEFYYIVISAGNEFIMFGGAGLYLSSAMVSIPAQAFFVYRMWQFSRRPWFIPTLAIPVLLFQLVFPLALISNKIPGHEMPLFIATCVAGAILDLLTCIGLTVLLWRKYVSWSTQKSTTSVLLRLILLSINTGLWTTVVSIYVIVVLISTVRAHEQPPLGCFHLISPLYFATVLINLNSRHYVREAGNRSLSRSIRLGPIRNPLSVSIPLGVLTTTDVQSSKTDSMPSDSTRSRSKDDSDIIDSYQTV